MKLLKFVMYLFYRYYAKGATFRIPYISALTAVVFLIYIHIFQVLIILDKVDAVLPMKMEDAQIIKYFKFAIFLLPLFLIIGFLVKKRDLENVEYEETTIKKGNISLVIYVVTSVVLLFTLMIMKSQ